MITVKKEMGYDEYNLIRNALMDNIPSKVINCEFMKDRRQAVFNFSDSIYVPRILQSSIIFDIDRDDLIELNADITLGFIKKGWETKESENANNKIKMSIYEDPVHPNCVDINAKCSCGAEETIEINPEEIEYDIGSEIQVSDISVNCVIIFYGKEYPSDLINIRNFLTNHKIDGYIESHTYFGVPIDIDKPLSTQNIQFDEKRRIFISRGAGRGG